jgi:hypothetical protein
MTTAILLLQVATRTPLPAEPPISGPGWTILVPAVLFLISAVGTWSLWRHFADKDDEE